ncbi:Heterokaryon incompatibility [Macrophomina phaseolina MS6]|uniref:Heterokaryon incompatibility n=1 Tax=Macrophomina phaseolina (strain MS6) TaxID=1126212 RepID=K2RSL1_MACPH|nr:Heterokaryon incompatibility [Macrophomina phaseolina MS6]
MSPDLQTRHEAATWTSPIAQGVLQHRLLCQRYIRMSLARRVAGALAKRRAPEFSYEPLPGPTSIRLLKISPPTGDHLIHCTLSTVDISTIPTYEALSYTWAIDSDLPSVLRIPTGETRTIIVDNSTLDIFKNLYNALIQLQELGKSGVEAYIWIDAICINQKDEVEKSVQVNMMGDIFRRAERVVVWLGQSSMATDLALKKARPFFTDVAFDDDVSTVWNAVASRSSVVIALEALSWVLSRGWFARVWTLQEVVLAKKVVYLIGAQEVEFDKLVEFSGHYASAGEARQLDGMFHHLRSRMAGLDFARSMHEQLDGGTACTLEAAVTEARNRRAGDGRDKLFGVLSLVQCFGSTDAEHLAADYTKSIQEVYRQCAAALIQSQNTGMFLLSLVGQIREGCSVDYAFPSSFIKLFRPDKGFVQDLPSWVPDLSAPVRPFPLREITTLQFSAALSVEPEFAIAEEGGVLEMKAAVLDAVVATGDCRSTRLLQPIWRLWRLLSKLGSKDTYTPTGEPLVSAFWRTLVAGSTHTDEQDGERVELTDKDFVEWFAIFAEEVYSYSERRVRELILEELDEDDPANVIDLAAEPDDRRRRTFTDLALNEKESARLDRYKVHAIRQFIASFDAPEYGFREAIKTRHERFKGMSEVEVQMEQKLWVAKGPLFDDVFERSYVDRRIFVTEKGYLGTAPWTVEKDDVVMLVAGTYVPYVFRPSQRRKGGWELVGEAYCHGVMFGEGLKKEGTEFQMIKVV